jgi:hypothetical protein
MPRFFTEELDIDVDDFLSSCSTKEIKEIINLLQEEGHLEYGYNITGRESINERMFLESLFKIKDNWMNLSKEEEDIILNISKRF